MLTDQEKKLIKIKQDSRHYWLEYARFYLRHKQFKEINTHLEVVERIQGEIEKLTQKDINNFSL